MTPEGKVKSYLWKRAASLGWACIALENPYKKSWPDRALFADGGRVCWVEVKATGIKHDPAHLRRQAILRGQLRQRGHLAFQVTGRGGVDKLLEYLVDVKGWPTKERQNDEKGKIQIQR